MSLQLAAQHLAAKGRGPDDTLVHMSRNEVKSLSDLAMAHGGQLSINPETGLPEAGFLSAILPMVAGAALGPAGLGLSAMQAGLLVGAGSYLMNPRAGLMGGLTAGLGGYGGAGLGAGLRDIATSEAGLTSTGASMDYTAQNAEAIKNAQAFEQAKLAEAAKYTSPNYMDVGGTGANYLPTGSGGLNVTAPYQGPIGADYEHVLPKGNLLQNPLTGSQLGESATGFDAMSRGAKSLFTDPTAEKFKTLGGGDYMGLAKTGLAAAAPVATATPTLNMPNVSTAQKQQVVPHYRYEPGMATPTPAASATGIENTYFPGSRYTPVSSDEASRLYPGYPAAAAGGGLMNSEGGYQADPNLMQVKTYDPVVRMATGGISDTHYNLGGYSDGGRLLRGPGDGVSDSIPAVIGKKQPARLADGEFVVPARIVSELGNGSTEAGARKLYAMMDRVQAARRNTVGKGKVARNSRADKYLPA
jgi:hypothetical protein